MPPAGIEPARSEREDILDALKGRPKTVVKKKRGGLIRMVVIGGGAYVLGTRAGRSRYEQIVDWAKSMKDRGRRDATDDFRSDVVSAGNGGSKTDPDPVAPTGGFGSTGSGTSGPGTTGPTVSSKKTAESTTISGEAQKPAGSESSESEDPAPKKSGTTGS